LVVGAEFSLPLVFDYLRSIGKADGFQTYEADLSSDTSSIESIIHDRRSHSNHDVFGPTSDLRLKPDMFAPGTHVLGANANEYQSSGACISGSGGTLSFGDSGDINYAYLSHGPSIAAGVVGGLAAIVRQYLVEGRYVVDIYTTASIANPSGALSSAIQRPFNYSQQMSLWEADHTSCSYAARNVTDQLTIGLALFN